MSETYVLATGDAGLERLRVVDRVHGADTRIALKRHLQPGMRVADIGCGAGIVTSWIAQQAGPDGHVVGIDASREQIKTARQISQAAGGYLPEFHVATAGATGLRSSSFDLVFSRFVLMHVREPGRALAEMHRILKPDGVLIVEDGDFTTPFCWPQSRAYDRCFELYRSAGEQHNEDFLIGRKLYSLVYSAGYSIGSAVLAQPVLTDNAAARSLPRWTLEESAAALIAARLSTQAEIDSLCKELAVLEADHTVLFAMARVTQICAKKPSPGS